MNARGVEERLIAVVAVTIVEHRLRGRVQNRLPDRAGIAETDRPADNATGPALDQRQDVGFVFLSPIKVYNSSCSTTVMSSGQGG